MSPMMKILVSAAAACAAVALVSCVKTVDVKLNSIASAVISVK